MAHLLGVRDSSGALAAGMPLACPPPAPQGSYVWKLNYRAIDRPNSLKSEVGTITLLK